MKKTHLPWLGASSLRLQAERRLSEMKNGVAGLAPDPKEGQTLMPEGVVIPCRRHDIPAESHEDTRFELSILPGDNTRLLHELQVQRIELEVQNEELRRARDEAEEALALYISFYEFAPVGFFTIDEYATITNVNLTGSILFGVERSVLIGQRFDLWIHPAEMGKFKHFVKESFRGYVDKSCEVTLINKGLIDKNLVLKAELLEQDKSSRKQCRLTALDITLHKQAERALESEKELFAIFQSAPIIMILMDGDRQVIKANQAALQAVRRDMDDALGLRCGEMLRCVHALDDPLGCGFSLHCQTCVIRETEVNTLVTGKASHRVEAQLTLDLGSGPTECYFLFSTSLLNIEGRRLTLVCMEDVTEANKAQEALLTYQHSLKEMAAELFVAEERERRRIASDLHDSVVQQLGLSSQKLKMLRSGQEDQPQHLDEVIESLDQAIIESRSLIGELSPPVLYIMGLAPALEELAQSYQERRSLMVDLDLTPLPQPLTKDLSVFLYRACSELLNNVIKHARGQGARLSLGLTGQELVLSVEDSGKGFIYSDSAYGIDQGFGLFNIREMLRGWWGSLTVERSPMGGARVSMIIPTKACWPGQ